jgi:DHA1 family bicyclomycin/chloramphenicol resistance-like MFS transporter
MHQNIKENQTYSFKFLEFTIYLLFLFGPLTGNIIMVLIRVLSQDFYVSHSAILVAIPAFMFPFALTQLFSGAISDIKGRIPVLIGGLILFAIAMLIAALAISLEMFAIANFIGGVGFGLINPVLIALMTDIIPPPSIPKKLGYLSASANLGVGLGPLIASQMILIGWRSIYILFIIIACFGLVYMIKTKRPSQEISEDSGIKIFLKQLHIEWRRLVVVLMMISAFLISHTYLAINIWTSRTLAGVVEEWLTGIVLGLAGVGAAITGIITGSLIKRKDVKLPFVLGSLILFSSLITLLFIGDVTRSEIFFILAIGWILGGLAGGILFTSITYYSQVLSPERRGALAGSLTASYFAGIALVPTTLAPIYENYGITGVYVSILIISVIFVFVITLLYRFSKDFIIEGRKTSH